MTHARPSPAVFRRRRIAAGVVVVIVVLIVALIAVLVAPVPFVEPTVQKPAEARQPAAVIEWPGVGSGALAQVGRPGMLATSGSAGSVPMASMAKTITALVILDAKPIRPGSDGPTIRFTAKDVAILRQVQAEEGSWAPVVAGEQLTERQALEAMLLPSANNYAISLANWAFGSVSGYLKAARSWLATNGYTGTRVTDPAGLDPRTVSSPADLISLGERVIANPVLAGVVNTSVATLPGAGRQKNGNKLLGSNGVTGIKTGFTDEAGHCLLFSSDLKVGGKTITVVGVVLGQPSSAALFSGARRVLASARSGYRDVTLTAKGNVFGTFTTAWGTKENIVAESTASEVLYSDAPVTVQVQMKPVGLAAAGTPVGTARFTADGHSTTVALVTKNAVLDPGVWWRLGHPFGLNT